MKTHEKKQHCHRCGVYVRPKNRWVERIRYPDYTSYNACRETRKAIAGKEEKVAKALYASEPFEAKSVRTKKKENPRRNRNKSVSATLRDASYIEKDPYIPIMWCPTCLAEERRRKSKHYVQQKYGRMDESEKSRVFCAIATILKDRGVESRIVDLHYTGIVRRSKAVQHYVQQFKHMDTGELISRLPGDFCALTTMTKQEIESAPLLMTEKTSKKKSRERKKLERRRRREAAGREEKEENRRRKRRLRAEKIEEE